MFHLSRLILSFKPPRISLDHGDFLHGIGENPLPMSPKRNPLDVQAELEVTFQSTCFRLLSTGSRLIVQFENLGDSNRLLSYLKNVSMIDRTFISKVDRFLIDTDLTLCLFSKRLPVLGAAANPLLHRILATAMRLS